MILTLRQAGVVARMMQGRVANEGKQDKTELPNDDELLRARRAAKTAIDEIVQELLLQSAQLELDPSRTALDAEEATPSVVQFRKPGTVPLKLVLDPIDGTLEYLEGKDNYSVCVGLCRAGRMLSCAVYFPSRRTGYLLADDGVPYLYDEMAETFRRLPAPTGQVPKVVYKNGRVPAAVVKRLEAAGFTVRDDTDEGIGAPGAMLACLNGEATAYVSHTRNVRDILLGPSIGALPDGFATDWNGNDLVWPEESRIARAVFAPVSSYKKELLAALAE